MSFPERGILFPARLPTFERLPAPPEATALVAWFWIPRWNIAPGRTSRQHVLGFPASNLVVESASAAHPHGLVGLAGPTTARSHRDLVGRGWAVGANLRPAAVATFTDDPTGLQDTYLSVDAPDLRSAVTAAMTSGPDENPSAAAVAVFTAWLVDRVGPLDEQSLLANTAADLLVTDPTVLRPDDAADRLALSTRTLQRLTSRYVGMSPAAMIRRRRLQEAAERVRSDPDTDLATLAAELGYADHAHLTNEFHRVLAMPPSEYRRRF